VRQATRAGQSFDDYVAAILKERAVEPYQSTSREAVLLDEYRLLVKRKFDGNLSVADAERLQAVQVELDDIEEASAVAQDARRKMDAIQTTLDQLIATVSALPTASTR